MSTQLEQVRAAAAPGRVGQGTAIEQSRAIAEVQAQVIVAQQFPRSVRLAIDAMEEACKQPELAERAFFRFERGKLSNGKPNIVSGPSVHLARELARCWGNIQYGITEMLRDDEHGQSEMKSWAWDLQTNTTDSNTFIVPHKRDTKNGVRDLTDMRDIYENNANNGARRLREALFAVMPVWYRARAEKLCMQTIENGGGQPLAQRIADAVKAFERFRVSPARMAAKFGHASVDDLTTHDVAQLRVIWDSLQQGTVTVDDEFEPEPSRSADLADGADAPPPKQPRGRKGGKAEAADRPTGAAPAAASEEDSASQDPAPAQTAPSGERRQPSATPGQVGAIREHFERLGYGDADRDARLRATARIARSGAIGSTKELTSEQAARVLVAVRDVTDAAALQALLEDDSEVPGNEN